MKLGCSIILRIACASHTKVLVLDYLRLDFTVLLQSPAQMGPILLQLSRNQVSQVSSDSDQIEICESVNISEEFWGFSHSLFSKNPRFPEDIPGPEVSTVSLAV